MLPTTGGRRVCGTASGIEAEGHDRGGVDLADDVEHGVHVGAPAQVRLEAVEGDEVVLGVLEADGVEDVARPVDHLHVALHADLGPELGEVVERIGVDVGERRRRRFDDDVAERRGRRTGGVEPPARATSNTGLRSVAVSSTPTQHLLDDAQPLRSLDDEVDAAGQLGDVGRLDRREHADRSWLRPSLR